MSGTEASAHAAVGECADLPMCGRSRLNVRLAPARTASHEVGLATEVRLPEHGWCPTGWGGWPAERRSELQGRALALPPNGKGGADHTHDKCRHACV
jgi:hypothetical protein